MTVFDNEIEDMTAAAKDVLGDAFDADVILEEFPYFLRDPNWRGRNPATRSFWNGPYRADLIFCPVDREALHERFSRVLTTSSMIRGEEGMRRYRRAYCDFLLDGPMTREYYETEHHRYGESSASRAVAWLLKYGFLAESSGEVVQAVDIPFHTEGIVVELKPRDWKWALEQAERTKPFADYRYVALDADHINEADVGAFADAGVGLIELAPDQATTHVEAERSTPNMANVLSRYNCERWDMNERVLNRLSYPEDLVGGDEDHAIGPGEYREVEPTESEERAQRGLTDF